MSSLSPSWASLKSNKKKATTTWRKIRTANQWRWMMSSDIQRKPVLASNTCAASLKDNLPRRTSQSHQGNIVKYNDEKSLCYKNISHQKWTWLWQWRPTLRPVVNVWQCHFTHGISIVWKLLKGLLGGTESFRYWPEK